MRKLLIFIVLSAVSFCLPAAAGPSVPFNLVFNKQNENVLTFTKVEPDPGTDSEAVDEASSVSFPSLMSESDYAQYREKGVLSASIAAYWDVYGKGVTIYLTFGSGEYMLMNADSNSSGSEAYKEGLNYNVDISTKRKGSINEAAMGFNADEYNSGARIYLVGSEEAPASNPSGRVVGSVTLNLGLPLPADNGIFPSGQYDGLITLNLVIME